MYEQHQPQRLALAAVAVALVTLLAGCANANAAAPAPPTATQAAATSTTAAATTAVATTRAAPTRATTKPSPAGDNQPGCAARAMARGTFNPACAEYQGYLDPGTAGGRAPTSGEIQQQTLCRTGQVPKSEC